MEFHLVTNGMIPFEEIADFMVQAEEIIDFLHIRDSDRSALEVYKGIQCLTSRGVPPEKLIVNDRTDAAAAAGIHRVQLGYRSLPPFAVKAAFSGMHAGKSVHSLEEALQAEAEGANSVLFGHVFPTESKKGLEPKGLEQAGEIAEALEIEVLAIGGIEPVHIPLLQQKGIKGFAVMSGIWGSGNWLERARAYRFASE
ncbi:thiamine phosphate synthase [Metabacillus mangrovi]|uniref:thiamine phosphate synthase n=1 Tax=Metabacillus mangrovi TaxID=1491830 RepID=UPI0013914061|nr:thiamine phosphate synthase [Metabacillus mangrovi]